MIEIMQTEHVLSLINSYMNQKCIPYMIYTYKTYPPTYSFPKKKNKKL